MSGLPSQPARHEARAARHSCVVSHRLFTEQELTFPQTRPHPEGKRKARPRTCLEQTPTRPDGAAVSRASSARAGAGQSPGQGPPRVTTCPPRDLCWDAGTEPGCTQEGLQPPPLQAGPRRVSLPHTRQVKEPRQGQEGAQVPPTGGLASAPVFSSQTFCSRRTAGPSARGGWSLSGGAAQEPSPLGVPISFWKRGAQGPVPKASAGQGPAWALPSAPSASGCTRTRGARGPGGTGAGSSACSHPLGLPQQRRSPLGAPPQRPRPACTQTPPGPSADRGTPREEKCVRKEVWRTACDTAAFTRLH